MLDHPLEQFFVAHASVSNRKADVNKLLVCTPKTDPVHLQEGQHNIEPDSLVPIHKCVIGDKRVAQSRSLFFLCGVELYISITGKSTFQGGFQKSLIPYSYTPACRLCQQLMEKENFFFRATPHRKRKRSDPKRGIIMV